MRRIVATALPCVLALACVGCTPPPQEPADKPVEPTATQLRDAIREPLDAARDTQKTVEDAAAQQRKAIDDAGG
ncbi:hypothetical protein AO715_15870 [Xanthomonas sp. Mitacek01]|nr:hypothetical protein AO715_15870 [Xanthomonas sp. Mitacek01]